MPRTPTYDLQLDDPVFSSDGHQLGVVKEIRRDAFKIDAPWRPDYWVPCDAIRSVVPGERVTLAVLADDVGDMKRDAPERRDYDPTRALAYGETWRGTPSNSDDSQDYTGPDYLEPGREWETGPVEPRFRYGAWKGEASQRSRQYADEVREPSIRATDRDNWWGRPGEPERNYPGSRSRYRGPSGPAGNWPRYDQERGWGYQGQGGWSGRFGAPGTYGEPRGATGFGEEGRAAYTGQPGRGYDADVWGYDQAYDTEAPRGYYAGRGPRSYHRPDNSIREDVCETLTRDGEVDASDIEVDVKDGEVRLKGWVETRYQKRRAEDIVGDLPGVRDVRNELRAQTSEITPPRATML